MTGSPMIRVEGLTYSYLPPVDAGPRLRLFNNLSFEVAKGECLAISGSAGCGKTTLCLALAGLAPRLTGGRLSGSITVAGRDVQAAPVGSLADVLGLALEEPTGQLFSQTIIDELAWGLESLGISPDEMPDRIQRALEMVGLQDLPPDQSPQTLSGGQQKRLAIATALVLNPQVLILDHPSSGLSPLARVEMVHVLKDLKEKYRLTLFLAESDSETILHLADRLAFLKNGIIDQVGAPDELVYRSTDGIQPPIVRFVRSFSLGNHLNKPQSAEDLSVYLKKTRFGPIPPRMTEPTHAAKEPAIEIKDIYFHYPGGTPVLKGISCTICSGEFVAIIGDNGAGKTTLARHLIGLARPAQGQIEVLGRDIASQSIGALASQIGFAFQNPELQIFNATVRDEIAFGPRNLGLDAATIDHRVQTTLDDFGLTDLVDYPPALMSLSGRRLVALASISALQTPVIILDEPTVGLDQDEMFARVITWLSKRHREGATVLLITHDMELVARKAERVIVMVEGKISGDGAPHEIFSKADLLEQAGLEPPFAVKLAHAMNRPELGTYLTPEDMASALSEAVR